MTGAVKMWSRANWEQSGLITHQRPISLKGHRRSSTDHRDTYGMTSKSLHMCPSRSSVIGHRGSSEVLSEIIMRPISLKDHRESSTDHRDTYGMTSKSLQMCPSRGNAKWHSRPSRDDGVERQDFFFRRDRRRCFILKVPGRCE